MARNILTILLILLLGSGAAPAYAAGADPLYEQQPPDHSAWDKLLRQNSYPDGTVNYNGFALQRAELESYIRSLEDTPPSESWSREEKLAYYINLYNAVTVRLILDHFPVESILNIRNPWGQKLFRIGDAQHTLNELEHEILRKLDEPRIHFAINCASFSCPVLQPFAFTASELETQLEMVARNFINDPKRNRTRPGSVSLSRIFKWYREDFAPSRSGLIEYINGYLETPLPQDADFDFLPYDWSLNRP